MANADPKLHPENLTPGTDMVDNTRALRHGLYSDRVLAPQAEKVADALMQLPHVHPIDELAALEVGRLEARIEAIDGELDRLGMAARNARRLEWLLESRRRYSAQLLRALAEFGATPKARSDWAAKLAAAEDTLEARRARRERERDGAGEAAIEAQRVAAERAAGGDGAA
jgi:hypothetical protein